MSRVFANQKYMNVPIHDNSVYQPSKVTRIHWDGEDYHKARTLTSWLFMKYDMSYKSYQRKSKSRKQALRDEFEEDTGVHIKKEDDLS